MDLARHRQPVHNPVQSEEGYLYVAACIGISPAPLTAAHIALYEFVAAAARDIRAPGTKTQTWWEDWETVVDCLAINHGIGADDSRAHFQKVRERWGCGVKSGAS